MTDDAPYRLYQAFVAQDPSAAISVVESVRSTGIPQAELFDTLFTPALALLGGAWAAGEIDEFAFTQASVVAEQISSFVTPAAAAADTGVTVLLGTIRGDRHAVTRNVVAAALKEAGHRVADLGVEVRAAEFLEKVEETGARILIVCAEMTATSRDVARVREMLSGAGRDDVVMLVAGGPFEADPELARGVGANGVIRGAESALRLVGRVAQDLSGGAR